MLNKFCMHFNKVVAVCQMAVTMQGVSVGVWFFLFFVFFWSPFAFNLHCWLASCVQHRKKESRVSVSPCQWTASPRQQVLCSAFSWRGVLQGAVRPCHWICVGDFCTTQWWNRRKRRKLPMTVNADEVVQDLCDPTVDQTQEEKTPNGCDSGWGRTSYILSQRWIRRKRRKLPTAVKAEEDIHKYIWPNGGTGRRGKRSQWLWKRKRSYKVSPMRRKTLWTNLGRTDSSALVGNWRTRENSDKKKQTKKKQPKNKKQKNPPVFRSWNVQALMARRRSCIYASFNYMTVQMTFDRCGVVFMDFSQVRTAPDSQPQKGPPHATDCDSGSPVARRRQRRATGDS